MGAQIPVMSENPLTVCGCRKFQVDTLGDHLCTCTVHSGVKKDCGDIELAGYLTNSSGTVSLVLDLRVAHDKVLHGGRLYSH
jgi:hypothetical protein